MTRLGKQLIAAIALGCAAQPLAAREAGPLPPDLPPLSEIETADPEMPPVLPLREQARLMDALLRERLDTLVPRLMRETGIDLWVVSAREYFEDPVTASMLDAESLHARRRTILVFHDPGEGKPIERLTISRYGLGGLFAPAWDPGAQPDQWRALADAIAARDPQRIGINTSPLHAFADGMTASEYTAFLAALPEALRTRVVSAEPLAMRWLETRTPSEMALYPLVVRSAHALIAEAMSTRVITPGTTTAGDVEWWYRQRLSELGLKPWFHPSVGIQRQGAAGMLHGDTVIAPGDLLWTDFGITYLRLNTDTQHLAYVPKPGESAVPEGLAAGLRNSNRVQDLLREEFRTGRSGNAILAAARAKAIGEGLDPSIYTHPIGFHGHGAGPSIGYWDNQNGSPSGAGAVNPDTAWSIELTSYAAVPEWGGQKVDFRTEEDAFFDGRMVRFIDGRQTAITLVR
mgnify:CR=1 FL=1